MMIVISEKVIARWGRESSVGIHSNLAIIHFFHKVCIVNAYLGGRLSFCPCICLISRTTWQISIYMRTAYSIRGFAVSLSGKFNFRSYWNSISPTLYAAQIQLHRFSKKLLDIKKFKYKCSQGVLLILDIFRCRKYLRHPKKANLWPRALWYL